MSLSSRPAMSQGFIEKKLSFFLKALGDENLESFSKGLCNAFAFMQFRDALFDLKDKHQIRMRMLLIRDTNKLKEMAKNYNEFKRQRQQLLELSKGKTAKENELVESNQRITQLYQELRNLRKIKNVERETKEKIASIGENLKDLRKQREVVIKEILKTIFSEDNWRRAVDGEDLYLYIHTLVSVFHPGKFLNFHIGDKYVNQSDFVEILEGLQLQPLINDLSVGNTVTQQTISAIKTFEIAFNFTKEELIKLLSNQYDENNKAIYPGDLIHLASTKHAIFLKVTKEGEFKLFNPGPVELDNNSPEALADAIKSEFFTKSNKKADFMPLKLTMFTKTGEEQKSRPDRAEIIKIILKERIANKIDINGEAWNGATPVWIVAQCGHADVLKILIDAKANLDKADEKNLTPALIAVQNGHSSIIRLLAEAHVDLNKIQTKDMTLARKAALHNHVNVIKELIKANVDINQPNFQGSTPVNIAAQKGHINVIKILVEAKADLNFPCDAAISILAAHAKKIGRQQAFNELLQKYNINSQLPLKGFSPLHAAVVFGHEEAVKILLQNGALVDAKAGGQISALDFAVTFGNDEMVSIFSNKNKYELTEQNSNDVANQNLLSSNALLMFKQDDNEIEKYDEQVKVKITQNKQ